MILILLLLLTETNNLMFTREVRQGETKEEKAKQGGPNNTNSIFFF